jgi:hypothetical protein
MDYKITYERYVPVQILKFVLSITYNMRKPIIIIIIIIIQFFIIYVPSQQLQGQLQTQHSVDTGNYIMDKHNIRVKSKTNYRQALKQKTH